VGHGGTPDSGHPKPIVAPLLIPMPDTAGRCAADSRSPKKYLSVAMGEKMIVKVQEKPFYSVLQKSVAKSRVLENAIDSRMRIKTTTYSDVQQKPCQFYWHGLLHVTIGDKRLNLLL
jgi:hypothetical protein